jgi:hypothetical protein
MADGDQQPLVEIVAAQMRVAVAGQNFDHALLDLYDRDVGGAAAEIVRDLATDRGWAVLLAIRWDGHTMGR